jgi:hypothetical protein
VRKRSSSLVQYLGISLSALLLAGCAGTPTVDTGPNAEVTYDGLYRVRGTSLDDVWVKADFDLTPYSKIMPVNGGIAYREVRDPGNTARARSSATEFPISQANRRRLVDTVSEEFRNEFEGLENYELVSEPGPDVLTLKLSLIDVVSSVPPETIGRTDVYLRSVGEATLVLELYDSESGELLARAVDRRAAESAYPQQSNPVTNWAEVRRLASTWARILRQGFDTVRQIAPPA